MTKARINEADLSGAGITALPDGLSVGGEVKR